MKYKIRASLLNKILANPSIYFEEQKDLSHLPQIKKGRSREIISYELFNDFKKDLDIEYEEQKEGIKNIGNVELIGHADIVSKDYIVDIKNSKQDDNKLIEEYKYQLAAYSYLFDIKDVYLFVDNNSGTNTDLRKCRLIKVDISNINLEEIITKLEKKLDTLNQPLLERDDLEPLFFQYEETKRRLEEIKKELSKYEEEIEKIFAKNNHIKSKDYTLKPVFKRDLKYKNIKEQLPWHGDYKESWELLKVEGEIQYE